MAVHRGLCVLLSFVHFSSQYNLDVSFPLVYRFPRNPTRLSYFGMSSLLRTGASDCPDSWVVQIGAPRGNVSELRGISEPGAVYRCKLHGPCEPLVLDSSGNKEGWVRGEPYHSMMDGAWIGGVMTVAESSTPERILVCGHRWANTNRKNAENIDFTYLMTGVCYSHTTRNCKNSTVEKLLPLVSRDNIYGPKGKYDPSKAYYDWGLGQAGTSVHIRDTAELIGGPGILNSRGAVVVYESGKYEVKTFNSPSYSYTGYQVTSGRFFADKEEWFVTSAPRASSVAAWKKVRRIGVKNKDVKGEYGEYFGWSLAVADVNNDRFDDLLVGAPLFSNEDPDVGRVYICLGGKEFSCGSKITGKAAFGRFGSCVAGVGDLDRDGYSDVAVGAPYEEDNKGAVYIFRGSATGLKESQRIAAGDIDASLLGFGVSITNGADVDGNGYKDVAVGAYLSDATVLLRSRPVVTLQTEVQLRARQAKLDRYGKAFNISVCSLYFGPSAPPLIRNVTRQIKVDPEYGRAVIAASNSSVFVKTLDLTQNISRCEVVTVLWSHLNRSDDAYRDVAVRVQLKLPPCFGQNRTTVVWGAMNPAADRFDKACVLLRAGTTGEVTKEFSFEGQCGTDKICQSDLAVECDIEGAQNDTFVLGSPNGLKLVVKIKNKKKEPAQEVGVVAVSNRPIQRDTGYFSIGDRAEDVEETTTSFAYSNWRNLDSTLTGESERTVSHDIDPTLLENGPNTFNVTVKGSTASEDTDPSNNECGVSLRLVSDASLDLLSYTQDLKLTLKNDNNVFTHSYEVRHEGVTPMQDVNLTVQVAHSYKAVDAFTIKYEDSLPPGTSSAVSDAKMTMLTVPSTPDEFDGQANRTLFINCTSEDADVNCTSYSFFISRLSPFTGSIIKMTITLNYTMLEPFTTDKDFVYFTTNAWLHARELIGDVTITRRASASTKLHISFASKVDTYVITLSVLGGLLLLFFIISALVREEFFRRKTKERLDALKNEQKQQQLDLDFIQNLEDE